MKNLFLKTCLITLFMLVSKSNAQSCPIPEAFDKVEAFGIWQGNFTFNGEFKGFTLYLNSENDKFKAQLTIPSISSKKINTETKICQSEELHVRFKINNKEYELTGKPKNNSMSGRLSSKDVAFFSNDSSDDAINEVFTLKKIK